jgi:hypothetical protein
MKFFFIAVLFIGGLFFLPAETSAQWTAIDSGLTNLAVLSFAVVPNGAGGAYLFSTTDVTVNSGVTGGGVFLSANNGTSWNLFGSTNIDATVFTVSDTNLFAGTFHHGVFLSTYTGTGWTNWTAVDSGLSNTDIWALAVSPSSGGAGGLSLFAGTKGNGIFRSTRNGTSWTRWTAVDSGLSNTDIWTLAVSPSSGGAGGLSLFAGTKGNGIFRSTRNGTSWTRWTAVDSGLTSNKVFALVVTPNGTDSSNIFAGTEGGGVFLSTNNGAYWTAVNSGLDNTKVNALAVSGTNLFAGTHDGIFLSTNNGTNWTAVNSGLTTTFINSIAVSHDGTGDTNIFVGTWGGGVFFSTDNGAHWTNIHSASMNPWDWTVTVSPDGKGGKDLLVGTEGGGAWRRPLSDINTNVKQLSSQPKRFTLSQNYPNPFNPTTTISYELPKESFVSLKVFDLLGREVTTLVSEEMSAGSYSRQWNATNIPSGIYFYRLQAGSFCETKKLVLLK